MTRRTHGLQEAWHRTLREQGVQLVHLISELNGDTGEQQEHWKRLTPGLRGLAWRFPDWPNLFPVVCGSGNDPRGLREVMRSEREYLRRFMDSWFACDRNYLTWGQKHSDLASALEESSQMTLIRFQQFPGDSLRPIIELHLKLENLSVEQRDLYAAAFKFSFFLLNPLRDVVAGHCKRCQRYFFNRKGYTEMVYCSQKCRWDSNNANKKLTRAEHQQKLERSAISRMRKLLTELETGSRQNVQWKTVVITKMNEKYGTKYEPKWLTRTVNNPDCEYHNQFQRLQSAIEAINKRKEE